MDRIIRLIVNLALIINAYGASATVPEKELEQINKRYDDFFRWIKARDDRYEKSQIATDDRKKAIKAREERLEREREKFVLERKAKPNTEPLRIKWEAYLKERQEQIELLRRRYVEQRDEAEHYLKKGRAIPELKEYDLEGY